VTSYDDWMNAHGLTRAPARDRRTAVREELDGIEKMTERALKNRKHAPDKHLLAAVDRKLDALDRREAQLNEELGRGPYIVGQSGDSQTCDVCGAELDGAETDYGIGKCCLPSQPTERTATK
jgi:hypothetical protein